MPSAHASAQSPVAAASARSFDVSLGYSYTSRFDSSSDHVGLNGVDATISKPVHSRLQLRADLGYARAANVFGTSRHSDVLSYLAGPAFYPITLRHFSVYVQGLMGGARVTGPILLAEGGFLDGAWVNRFSWAVGGGAEYQVSDSTTIRTSVDFLRTAYFESAQAIRGQSNITTAASLVHYFGRRSRRGR